MSFYLIIQILVSIINNKLYQLVNYLKVYLKSKFPKKT